MNICVMYDMNKDEKKMLQNKYFNTLSTNLIQFVLWLAVKCHCTF